MNTPPDAREVYCDEQGEPIAYCPKDSLGLTDIQRATFFRLNDPPWRTMPGFDWQQFRDRGETPVSRGVVPREPIEAIAREAYPAMNDPPDGIAVFVFAAGGVSVFSTRDFLKN